MAMPLHTRSVGIKSRGPIARSISRGVKQSRGPPSTFVVDSNIETIPTVEVGRFSGMLPRRTLPRVLPALAIVLLGAISSLGLLAYKRDLHDEAEPTLKEFDTSSVESLDYSLYEPPKQTADRSLKLSDDLGLPPSQPNWFAGNEDNWSDEGLKSSLDTAASKASGASNDCFKHYRLPRADVMEDKLLVKEQSGKGFVADLAKRHATVGRQLSPGAQQTLSTLASLLSAGKRNQLIGMTVSLENIMPFEVDLYGYGITRQYRVVEVIHENLNRVMLEVLEEESGRRLALNIMFAPRNKRERIYEDLEQTTSQERQCLKVLCSSTAPTLVAERYGLHMPLYTARLAGLPSVHVADNTHVVGEVQLMQIVRGALGDMWKLKDPIPMDAKAYISRRLLLQVLQLQKFGVSHNNIDWSNLFTCPDGSFLLGGFRSSSLIGRTMRALPAITNRTEPELLLESVQHAKHGSLPLTDQNSDMWSLGIMLYNLYTGNKLPYGLDSVSTSSDELTGLMKELLRDDVQAQANLRRELQRTETPPRWRDLICRLLEPQRKKRITAKEVVTMFGDLVWASTYFTEGDTKTNPTTGHSGTFFSLL